MNKAVFPQTATRATQSNRPRYDPWLVLEMMPLVVAATPQPANQAWQSLCSRVALEALTFKRASPPLYLLTPLLVFWVAKAVELACESSLEEALELCEIGLLQDLGWNRQVGDE